MENNKSDKKGWKINVLGVLIFLGVIFIWYEGWMYIDENVTPEDRGAFGDKFGFINSLFSALALGGIIYSIILQQKELSQQREELKETRKEFESQNFQTTFFNLLKTQQQIANEISTDFYYLKSYVNNIEQVVSVEGRQFFIQSKNELKRIIDSMEMSNYVEYISFDPDRMSIPSDSDSESSFNEFGKNTYTNQYYNITKEIWEDYNSMNSPIEKVKLVYGIFFNKFSHVIGHYFRHLYHIFKFIDIENEKRKEEGLDIDYEEFPDFIQAQMSIPELFLLYYNAIAFPKFQALLIKYNTFENLNKESLLDTTHIIDGANLKSNENLLKF